MRQVELAQLLLVECHPVWIVAVAGAEEGCDAGLLCDHLILQFVIGELLVPDDIDPADLRFWSFGDLENHIDAVLAQLHHLRFHRGRKTALAFVQLDNARDVRPDFGSREDLPRRQFDLREDLVALDAIIALDDDAVDNRVLGHLDQDGTAFVLNGGL